MTPPLAPITTDTAPPPAGTYSQAIRAGGLLFVAGQTPRRPDGARINDAPFEEQARQAMANVAAIATAAGTSMEHAVSVTCYLQDIEDRGVFDDVWAEFVTAPYPARAVVQSGLPGFAVELSAVIACPQMPAAPPHTG